MEKKRIRPERVLSAHVPRELYRAINATAQRTETTVSELLREAVIAHLERLKQDA